MRLNSYIIKEGRGKSVQEEHAVDFIKNHCKKALKVFLDTDKVIYRGMDFRDSYYHIDPKTGTRISANTSNEYTLIMDNDPRWKEYPKRSKSLICTTSTRKTNAYGNTYMVFAKDGSRYGVCPTEDLWQSFSTFKGMSMASVNNYLRDLGEETGVVEFDDMAMDGDATYFEVVTNINKIGDYLDNIATTHTDSNYDIIGGLMDNDIFRRWYKSGKEPFTKWFLDMYDPERNDFYVTDNVNKIFTTGVKNKEVWTDGESILVEFGYDFGEKFK